MVRSGRGWSEVEEKPRNHAEQGHKPPKMNWSRTIRIGWPLPGAFQDIQCGWWTLRELSKGALGHMGI